MFLCTDHEPWGNRILWNLQREGMAVEDGPRLAGPSLSLESTPKAPRHHGTVDPIECRSVAQACRYRRIAIGVKIATNSADQANAKVTSLVEPSNTDRTASTIGVIG